MSGKNSRQPGLMLILVLACLVLIPCSGTGQSNRDFVPRHSIQQTFISRTLPGTNQKSKITNTDQLDHLLQSVQESWRDYVKDSLSLGKTPAEVETLMNLDAYSYLMTLIWSTGNYEIQENLRCHLFAKYMMPSLAFDLNIVRSNPDLRNLRNIWPGSLSNTVIFGSTCTTDTTTYNDFYRLYSELNNFLTSLTGRDAETEAHIKKLLPLLAEFKYDVETKFYLINSKPDIALAHFITGLSLNKYQKERAKSVGSELIDYFRDKNENDKCLVILNTLALYTTSDELERDSLAAWYKQIDPERGDALYSAIQQKVSGEEYVISDTIAIDLPATWNFIANPISDSQLANCRYFLVDFWYTGCGPCIAEIPALNELSRILKERDDITVLSINTDYINGKKSLEFVKNFAASHNISFPVVFDNIRTEFNKHLKVQGYPTKFILDHEGNLVSPVDGSEITLTTFLRFIEGNN